MFKPICIFIGVLLYIFCELIITDVFIVTYFVCTKVRNFIRSTNENMVQFMLSELIVQFFFVNKIEQVFQFTLHTHFFVQSAIGSFKVGLSWTWMRASCIAPQTR